MATQEAYFVPRGEILSWINSTLCLRLTKVEETANGAVACQLLDALYPNMVPIKKVDFNAKNDYDMINNYKVMQDVFNKLGVEKHVDVNKLIKGRPLDNTEFMQWFKAFWDKSTGGGTIDDYDPVTRRQLCKTGGMKGSEGAVTPAGKTAAAESASVGQLYANKNASSLQTRRVPASYAGKGATPPPAPGATRSKRSLISSSLQNSDAEAIEHLHEEVSTWRSQAETFTKEKDFYYSKLRAIELLCNTPGVSGHPIAKAIEDILYAATSEEGETHLAAAIAQLEVHDDEEHELQQALHDHDDQHQAEELHMEPGASGSLHSPEPQQQQYVAETAAY